MKTVADALREVEAKGPGWERRALLQLRAELVAEGKANLRVSEAVGRPLTAAERDLAGRIQAELTKVNEALTAREREADRERMAPSLVVDSRGRVVGAREDDAPALALPALPSRTLAALGRLYPGIGADDEQRASNWRAALQAALGGSPLLPAYLASTATEGIDSDGGFVVSPDVAANLFLSAFESSVWMRIGARVENMMSSERHVNAFDDFDETDDAEATLKADWVAEEATATPQVAKLRRVVLHAKKLQVVTKVTNELGEDSGANYLVELERALGRAIGKKFDRAVLSGSGAGMPLGILNAPATITVSKEGGQAASTFLWENAEKMWARLAPGLHESSWWLIHPTVLPQALSMSLPIGTAGAIPQAAFAPGGPTGYTLLTRPVVVTSRVKVLGTKGDVVLACPSELAIGIRRGITIARSEHAFFTSDSLGIRATFRGDAMPFWSKARTLVDGGGTVSPFVVLEDR